VSQKVRGKFYKSKFIYQNRINKNSSLLGIGIDVEECFIHCAKAFKRSGLWDPNTWADKKILPSASKILFEHAKPPNSSVDSIQKRLEEGYTTRLY